jgi:SAM-dependent methyltransferase
VGFERIVLLDYSRTQLEQARKRLGSSERYIYVAADAYRLPFVDGLFDASTMIRTLHHMADAPQVLKQVRNVMAPGGIFILEFANKLNLKSILRYWLGKQKWSPFAPEPVEFVVLNFDFHPRTVRAWLTGLGFRIERVLTVSHFRVGWLKRLVPTSILVWLDSVLQGTGAWWQLTPSVFMRAALGEAEAAPVSTTGFFKCPNCGHALPAEKAGHSDCPECGSKWGIRGGIYDFREPLR